MTAATARTALLALILAAVALTLVAVAGGVVYFVVADQSRKRAEAAEQADRRRAAEIPEEIARLERRQSELVAAATAEAKLAEAMAEEAFGRVLRQAGDARDRKIFAERDKTIGADFARPSREEVETRRAEEEERVAAARREFEQAVEPAIQASHEASARAGAAWREAWESAGVKALQAEAGVLMREFDAIADRRPEWGLRRYYRKR